MSTTTERFVDAAAALIDLPIPPKCKAGVIENVERMQLIAQLFMSFPLPPDVESGGTFIP